MSTGCVFVSIFFPVITQFDMDICGRIRMSILIPVPLLNLIMLLLLRKGEAQCLPYSSPPLSLSMSMSELHELFNAYSNCFCGS